MSAKKAEVRIPVTDMDRLIELTDAQLRVWLYYKRREGADGKAYGKSTTIAAWGGYTSPTSFQSVKNARSWLTRNGWLKPNGKSQSGLPQFLAVIPRLPLEAFEGNPTITQPVITGLPHPSSYDYTEVPTLKEQPEKDSALRYATSGKASQLVSEEEEPTAPSILKPKKQLDPSLFEQEPETTPHPYYSKALGRVLDTEEVRVAMDLYLDLLPNGNMAREDIVLLAELALQWGMPYIRSIWFFNRLHKEGGLKFRTIEALANGLGSESDNNICAQMTEHDFFKCPKCKKLRKCDQCGEREDGTECQYYMQSVKDGYYPAGSYMHKGCGLGWYESKRSKAVTVTAQEQPQPCSNCGYRYDGGEGKEFHEQDCPNRSARKAAAE